MEDVGLAPTIDPGTFGSFGCPPVFCYGSSRAGCVALGLAALPEHSGQAFAERNRDGAHDGSEMSGECANYLLSANA